MEAWEVGVCGVGEGWRAAGSGVGSAGAQEASRRDRLIVVIKTERRFKVTTSILRIKDIAKDNLGKSRISLLSAAR